MEARARFDRPHASTENDVQTPFLCRPGGTAFILPSPRPFIPDAPVPTSDKKGSDARRAAPRCKSQPNQRARANIFAASSRRWKLSSHSTWAAQPSPSTRHTHQHASELQRSSQSRCAIARRTRPVAKIERKMLPGKAFMDGLHGDVSRLFRPRNSSASIAKSLHPSSSRSSYRCILTRPSTSRA